MIRQHGYLFITHELDYSTNDYKYYRPFITVIYLSSYIAGSNTGIQYKFSTKGKHDDSP